MMRRLRYAWSYVCALVSHRDHQTALLSAELAARPRVGRR